MRCGYCGRENENDKTVCSGCGTKLTYHVQANQTSAKSIILIIFVALICVIGIILAVTSLGENDKKKTSIQERIAESVDSNETDSADSYETEHAEEESIYTVVDEPVYKEYINKEYSLRMPYPSHFTLKDTEGENILFSAADPNGAARISLFAFGDMQGVIVNDIMTTMETSICESGGVIKDRQITQNGFFIKAKQGNAVICTQGYLVNGKLCCLEFSYAEFEAHVYEEYFNYMVENLKVEQAITEDGSNNGETLENIN